LVILILLDEEYKLGSSSWGRFFFSVRPPHLTSVQIFSAPCSQTPSVSINFVPHEICRYGLHALVTVFVESGSNWQQNWFWKFVIWMKFLPLFKENLNHVLQDIILRKEKVIENNILILGLIF
jgi:hypothetical protein